MAVFYKKAMDVDELWKHCAAGVKLKASQHFKTAENTRIAVGISC